MNTAKLLTPEERGAVGCEVTVSLNALETFCLDEWIEKHEEPRPSRPEAIRRLMRISLCGHPGQ